MQHRPAPDQRLVAGAQEADRNDLQSVTLRWQNPVFAGNTGSHRSPEHQRDVGAINVGIEQSDLVAHARQRDGQVYRQRGFADTAFARTDGDDAVDARKGLRAGLRLAGDRCMRMTHVCSWCVWNEVRKPRLLYLLQKGRLRDETPHKLLTCLPWTETYRLER